MTDIRLKYLIQLNPRVSMANLDKDAEVAFAPMECIKQGSMKPYIKTAGEYNSSYNCFENGDLLIAKVTPCFENGNIAIADNLPNGVGFGSSELFVIRTQLNAKLLFYIFQSNLFRNAAMQSMTGTAGLKRVSSDAIRNFRIKRFSEKKELSIVKFLDCKTESLETLISDKEKLIQLLEEKRTAIISSAVTKGIDSTTEMQDSGTEWLGYIPSHWRVVPAKALFVQSKETRHETDVQLTASQKYGIISQEDYMQKQSYKIVLADKGLENWKHVEPNDFIISLRSFQGGLEISYIPGCITWHYIVLKPKAGVEPEYFKWLFKSPRYVQALQRTANFIRDGQDLRFSNFVQVPLPLIPMDEQKEIAEYLNKETARIDSIIADITEQIEKLKEYRQSVISEVVTGKVAVE